MCNLRISVSDLDAYVYFRGSEQEPEELMRRLRKEEPPSPAMSTGIALHTALENAQAGEYLALEANGYTFNVMGSVNLALPEIRELKAEYPITIGPHLSVTLVGKVDAMEGLTVYDHKTTSRFEAEKFYDTFQWRYYLNIFNANTFQWNIFVLKQVALTEYDVTEFHTLQQHRYQGMSRDCSGLLREFLDFLNVAQMRFPKDECPLAALLKAN